MVIDDTLARILLQVQLEVREKYKKNYSITELHDIIETQIEATKAGFSKGITIHWTRFCKFVFTEKDKTMKDTNKFFAEIDSREDLLPHQIVELKKNYIIEQGNAKKEKLKKGVLVFSNSLTAVEVVTAPYVGNTTPIVFKAINRKHNKVE